ncbi:hypothetical protein [Massilia sp. TWR1-2-2]|uniref:hypothetical protein n=1 Tax=Massilia sp. TWR1-2-2 TaxID=2804584 RepID=UPI003CEDD0F1
MFNRSTQLMKSSRRPNDRNKWLLVPHAFPAIVTQARFDASQAERARRKHRWSDNELLGGLRAILARGESVTYESLDANNLLPSAKTYKVRFGSYIDAIRAAGVEHEQISAATTAHFQPRFAIADLMRELERCLAMATIDFQQLTCRTYRIGKVVARLLCTRCRGERAHPCWKVTLAYEVPVDFIIWARMVADNVTVAQLYLLPRAEFFPKQYLWPSTRTLTLYDQFAVPSIAHLFNLAQAVGAPNFMVERPRPSLEQRSQTTHCHEPGVEQRGKWLPWLPSAPA